MHAVSRGSEEREREKDKDKWRRSSLEDGSLSTSSFDKQIKRKFVDFFLGAEKRERGVSEKIFKQEGQQASERKRETHRRGGAPSSPVPSVSLPSSLSTLRA